MTLYTGYAAEVLAQLTDHPVDCVVTSPPYWGLRDYGTARWKGGDPGCTHAEGHPSRCPRCWARRVDRQIGIESDPERYVARLREVFDQLRRVVVDNGTVWLNLGDCYNAARCS